MTRAMGASDAEPALVAGMKGLWWCFHYVARGAEILSGAIIISFALVMYAGFRMQHPPLSPFQSIVTIVVVFFLAYAVFNPRSCRAFFNHPVEEAGEW